MISKCICVKEFYCFPENKHPTFYKNKTYEYTDQQFVTREFPDGFNVQFSKGEFMFFRTHQDPLAEKGFGLFDTYFKTIKDIRKEKLNKINGSILL